MMNERIRKPVGRRPSREGRKTFALCLGGAALLCTFGLTLTWARLAVVARGYELGRARAENAELHRQVAKLSLEIDALQNAHNVQAAALKLGLHKADRVLVVKPTDVASNPAPLAPERALASNEP